MSEHLKKVRQNLKTGKLDQTFIGSIKKHPLIHFSEDADKIMTQGFLFGEPVPHALDHSTHAGRSAQGELKPGYNFAFLATRFDLFNDCFDYEVGTPQCKRSLEGMYAKKALLFFADGLYTRHYDVFQQVIFWGQAADLKHAVLFERVGAEDDNGQDHHWIATTADGTPIVKAQELLVLRNCVAKVLLHLDRCGALSKSVREEFLWVYAEELGQLRAVTAA